MNQTHPTIDQIVDYLHGELGAADDAAIHAHFGECPACERLRADEVAVTDVLRARAVAHQHELPAGVIARIRERARPRPSGLRWFVLLPTAAAVAIIFYFAQTLHSGTTPVAIAPASYVEDHAAMAASVPFSDDARPVILTTDATH